MRTVSGPVLVEDDRRRQALRQHPALRGVDLSLDAQGGFQGSLAGTGPTSRRSCRYSPVFGPGRRAICAARRQPSAAGRRRRALARVDRDRVPAVDGGTGPVGGGDRIPRRDRPICQLALSRCGPGHAGDHARLGVRHRRRDAVPGLRTARAAADRGDRPRACARWREVRPARRADRGASSATRSGGCSSGAAARRQRRSGPASSSHHLEEVFEICQDVAVLRDGALVLTAPVAELSKDELVASMVGAGVPSAGQRGPALAAGHDARRDATQPVLTVDNLTASSPRGRLAGVFGCRSVPARVEKVTGLAERRGVGNAEAAPSPPAGALRDGGQITMRGQVVPAGRRDIAQQAGIGYVPEDRRAEGFVAHLGVAENVTMTITDRLADRLGLMRPGRRAAAAAPITRALSLVSSGPGQPVRELSGGNQQKVTVARTLAHDPGDIVADDA